MGRYIMAVQERSTEAFVGQALGDLAASYGGVAISVGRRLGLYRAMAGKGPQSSWEVASATGCEERYVREWLNSQVAAAYIDYHDESATYELPTEHVPVLVDEDSPLYLASAFEIPASMWFDQERTLDAFRTGKGIPWGEHDERLYCGIAAIYRNAYRASLVDEWIPALDGVAEKLERGAAVADVGCGYGFTTVLMASAFDRSTFHGFDTHAASIDQARSEARDAGVTDRVHFREDDAASYPGADYDLICFFDALHDLGDPVGAARHAYEALADDGTLMIVEPFAGDGVGDNVGAVARLYYTGSTMLCTTHSRSEDVGLALGAQAGPARLTEILHQAGFGTVRIAHETPLNMVIEAKR